jgi:L-alanine-DL-glutamate epimerase-like enolase superfamily enzyme
MARVAKGVSAAAAPRIEVREVRFYERPVRLRIPFRFGVATLREAPQGFIHVRVAREDGAEAWGMGAELMVPKWFDKNTDLTNEQNFQQLRDSLAVAREAYLANGLGTAWRHFAATYRAQNDRCAARGLNGLIASFGPAMIDRAVLDALSRMEGVSFEEAIRSNLPGIVPADVADDLADFDMGGFLARLRQRRSIHARHTIGMLDPLTAADQEGRRLDDGLPETLEEAIAAYGLRYFKIKVGGDRAADLDRLIRIAEVLDRLDGGYRATLDGNEQFDDAEGMAALWSDMTAETRLRRLVHSILFVEQPINRKLALERDIGVLARCVPVEIDESDDSLDAFPRARTLGYAGVSSKLCKGFYKSLINAARCARWNREGGRFFMSGEDLTTQAGLAVQQDLALVCLLGLDHVERNGHHYVDGFAGAPEDEAARFAAGHPHLYRLQGGRIRLSIAGGVIDTSDLGGTGFASNAEPDWSAMSTYSIS